MTRLLILDPLINLQIFLSLSEILVDGFHCEQPFRSRALEICFQFFPPCLEMNFFKKLTTLKIFLFTTPQKFRGGSRWCLLCSYQ